MTMFNKNVPRREEVAVLQNAVTVTRGIKMEQGVHMHQEVCNGRSKIWAIQIQIVTALQPIWFHQAEVSLRHSRPQ
jgi:hypothetical protein